MKHKYTAGTTITYCLFGETKERQAVILKANDTKNFKPVYDLDDGHWCYEWQIKSVVKEGGAS